MGATVIRSFVGEVASREFSFDVEIEGGGRRSALLFVQAQVASTNTADFSLEVGGEGVGGPAVLWEPLAQETLVGTNRRYRGGVWAAKGMPARVMITCGRAATVMAFVALVDEPAGERRELSVVVRELAAGETHEVRYVRPDDLVMKSGGGGIDWERTRYVAHGFVVEG